MHRSRSLVLLAPLVFVVGLAACGSDAKTISSSPHTSSTTATTDDTDTTDGTNTTTDTAPSDTTAAGDIAHPTGVDDLILRVGSDFEAPSLVIGGDGTAYVQSGHDDVNANGFAAAVPAPPAPTPFVRRQLTEAGVQIVLRLAQEKGLLQQQEYEDPGVTDMPYTSMTIADANGVYHHDAYALGFDEETGNRKDLEDFLGAVGFLEELVGAENIGDPEPYVPTTYLVHVGRFFDGSPANWPDDVDVTEGCVDLPVEQFPEGVAGLYNAEVGGEATRVVVVPDLPGDEC